MQRCWRACASIDSAYGLPGSSSSIRSSVGLGFGIVGKPHLVRGQVVVDREVVGRDAGRFAQAVLGAGQVAAVALGQGATHPDPGRHVAPDGKRAAVGFGGGGEVFASELDVGEVGQRIGMVGGGGEHVAIAGLGQSSLALRFVGEPQIVEHAGMTGSADECAPVMRRRQDRADRARVRRLPRWNKASASSGSAARACAPGRLGVPGIAPGQGAARLGQQRGHAPGRWRRLKGAVAILVALAAAARTGCIARRLRGDGAHPRCAGAGLRSLAYSGPCRTAGGCGGWRRAGRARRPGCRGSRARRKASASYSARLVVTSSGRPIACNWLPGNAADQRFAGAGDDREAGQQRIVGRRMRAVRKRIDKEIGHRVAGQVLARPERAGEYQPDRIDAGAPDFLLQMLRSVRAALRAARARYPGSRAAGASRSRKRPAGSCTPC